MYNVVVKKVHVRYLISWWVSCIVNSLTSATCHAENNNNWERTFTAMVQCYVVGYYCSHDCIDASLSPLIWRRLLRSRRLLLSWIEPKVRNYRRWPSNIDAKWSVWPVNLCLADCDICGKRPSHDFGVRKSLKTLTLVVAISDSADRTVLERGLPGCLSYVLLESVSVFKVLELGWTRVYRERQWRNGHM